MRVARDLNRPNIQSTEILRVATPSAPQRGEGIWSWAVLSWREGEGVMDEETLVELGLSEPEPGELDGLTVEER